MAELDEVLKDLINGIEFGLGRKVYEDDPVKQRKPTRFLCSKTVACLDE